MLILPPLTSNTVWAEEYAPYDGPEVIEDVSIGDGDSGIMPLSSHSISGNYGVGNTNTAIMAGVTSKLPFGEHYVYWRSGQYSYMLAHSRELVYENGRFRSPSVQLVTYYTYSGGSSQPTWSQSTDSNFSLSPGNYLVWSDLGDYPQLETGKGVRDYAEATVFALAVFFVLGRFSAFWRSIRGRDT